jgi:hypothetical protein
VDVFFCFLMSTMSTKIGARPGVKFSEVVKEAKEKGFTEQLPETSQTSRTRTCKKCPKGCTFGGVLPSR